MPKVFFVKQQGVFSTATGEYTYYDSLWASDGTVDGTYAVRQNLNAAKTTTGGISQLTPFGRRVAFATSADGGQYGDLWLSDGTAAGTAPILLPVATPSAQHLTVGGLTAYGGALLFGAETTQTSFGLWRSDGTAGGTVLLKSIFGAAGKEALRDFAVLNGQLYFIADFEGSNGVYNAQLWRSDGTAAGTVEVQPLSVSTNFRPGLEAVGGSLFYGVNTATFANDAELWKIGSNGVPALVKDITTSTATAPLSNLTAVEGTLFFTTYDGASGIELWKSDGTAAGTVLVRDIVTGSGSSNPANLTASNGLLYFSANTAASGNELWRSDGTAAGTYLVKDITAGSGSSTLSGFTDLGGVLLFTANGSIWRSDGTATGTVPVEAGLTLGNSEAVGSRAYFESTYTGGGSGLFSTAGLPGSTLGIQGGVDPGAGFTVLDVKRPARSDFNADGTSDVLLQNGGTVVDWLMGGGKYQSGNLIATGADGFAVRGKGDFNGDGQADIVLQSGGTVAAWIMGAGVYQYGVTLSSAAYGYDVVGTGDFNGDGTDDILLQSGGTVVEWLMQGGAYATGQVITSGAAGYAVKATGDLNGDGTDDIVLQNGGTVVDWIMVGGAFQSGHVLTTGAAGYDVKAAGDVNGDGTADIILQNGGTVVDWIVQGGAYAGGNIVTTGAAGFDVRNAGDYNRDGTSDILLQGGGTVVDWIMAGGLYAGGNVLTTGAAGFTVV